MSAAAPTHRCQCTGQCGETHAWTAERPAEPCRAPHGCPIVRKQDQPSFWQVIGPEGAGFEYRELYRAKPVEVVLAPVTIDGVELRFCQRCRAKLERKGQAAA